MWIRGGAYCSGSAACVCVLLLFYYHNHHEKSIQQFGLIIMTASGQIVTRLYMDMPGPLVQKEYLRYRKLNDIDICSYQNIKHLKLHKNVKNS